MSTALFLNTISSMKTLSIEDLSGIVGLQQEVVTSDLDLIGLMGLICERTQALTNATGAVVEIAEGMDMVYKACSGSLTKSVGLRLKRATSLSGMSVAKNEVLHCEDSETDPRVDREACRKVGACSMICVPLINKNITVGVLKVVSPVAHNFSEKHVTILRIIAGLLSASIAQSEAHKRLHDSERKFRTLVEDASDGIVISKDGLGVESNPAFQRIFGYSPEEIKGMDVTLLVTPEYRTIVQQNVQASMEQPYEIIGLKKDGSTFNLEVVGKVVIINGENFRMSSARDISEKKKSEEMLRVSEQKAREATQAKSDFLANMSHEIRTPLNGILGMASLLLDTNLNEQQVNYAEIIKNSGENLLNLVNDILDFSKIEARKLALEEIPFEIRRALEDIQHVIAHTANQKNLELKVHLDKDLPRFVIGDPTRIRQIIMNLVSNGIKFTATGSVSINVFPRNNYLRFEVIDTGIGIPEAALVKMFSAFTQVDSSTTRRYGGTGLGLSICRELVRMMNGEIGVESEVNSGSIFWFEIPLRVGQEIVSKVKNDPKRSEQVTKLRILVVEDNAVNSLIAKKMIEKLGHSVTLAGNGLEALSALRLSSYDLVFMDCQMPEMDGFKATTEIRQSQEKWRDVKIVAMTAHAMSGDREKCLQVGMDDYLSKPMKIEDIEKAIHRVL